MKYKDAKPWQKDSRNLKTDKVQVWTVSGVMLGLEPRESAARRVDEGFAFVMCDQAVGDYEDRYATYNE